MVADVDAGITVVRSIKAALLPNAFPAVTDRST